MKDLEIAVKYNIVNKFKIRLKYFLRFVDDIFTIVPNNSIDIILSEFNKFDPHIQLTSEIETDNSISFLEVQLIRNKQNSIITN